MPKVIQMSHMILRRLSVQECEKFFIDLLCYQHFPKSQPHYVEKSLQRNCVSSVGTTAQSNVNRFSIKTEKVHFENFLQSETLFGVNRSYKTPTEKKKAFREYSR